MWDHSWGALQSSKTLAQLGWRFRDIDYRWSGDAHRRGNTVEWPWNSLRCVWLSISIECYSNFRTVTERYTMISESLASCFTGTATFDNLITYHSFDCRQLRIEAFVTALGKYYYEVMTVFFRFLKGNVSTWTIFHFRRSGFKYKPPLVYRQTQTIETKPESMSHLVTAVMVYR